MKPIELLQGDCLELMKNIPDGSVDLIQTYSNEGNTVLDFTAGSMSTVVACINTKRNCIAIEKDEHYFNVGCERVHNRILDNNIDLRYNQVCGGVVLWQNSKTEQAKDMDGF